MQAGVVRGDFEAAGGGELGHCLFSGKGEDKASLRLGYLVGVEGLSGSLG